MPSYKKIDVEKTLSELSINDKVKLLGGKDFWHFHEVEGIVPPIRCSDGPNGVRGTRFFNGVPANCFPASTGVGASFDTELVERIGKALGDEARAKGAHIILGPTCNMQRSPLGGRGFESFAEDPHLSGMISAAYVNGVQSKGVSACLKHYVANDQDEPRILFERFSIDTIVSEKALREIYLEPFRLAVKHASPWSFMSSYNRVNGQHVSENKRLLDDVLRKEWGWDGLIMSDWTGVYSTDTSIKAGLDVEMPGPSAMRGPAVIRQLGAGKLTVADIDERVRNVLKLANQAIDSGIPFGVEEKSVDTPEVRALLREAAQSAHVLLKNDNKTLPLKADGKKIAVIGANAMIAVPSGGGSASLRSTYTVSPLEAIHAVAKDTGGSVEFAAGASAFRYVPLVDSFMKDCHVAMWNENPVQDDFFTVAASEKLPEPDFEVKGVPSSLAFMIDGVPYDKMPNPYVRWSTRFTPYADGRHVVGLGTLGCGTVLIDGKVVLENVESRQPGDLFFTSGSEERRATIELKAGKEVLVEVRHWTPPHLVARGPFAAMGIKAAALRLGIYPDQTDEQAREEAVALVKKSDLTVCIVGTNPDWETEGNDRYDMNLPGASDALVEAVLAANPNAVIVTQSGTPVAMPWISKAPTVLQAFFGGNEVGNGLADVLFGKVSPSGKLPVTFPVRLQDNPSYHSFGITSPTPGKVIYGEGVFIGYRHYDALAVIPLFPFGFGLSYTTFKFDKASVTLSSGGGGEEAKFSVSVQVTNTGSMAGRAVVQVYTSPPSSLCGTNKPSVPVKELAAFTKVHLEPGRSRVVQLTLDKDAFSHWDENEDAWVAREGTYDVLVGENSNELTKAGEAKLDNKLVWRGL